MIPADEANCAKAGKISGKQGTIRSLFPERASEDTAEGERVDTGERGVNRPAKGFVLS